MTEGDPHIVAERDAFPTSYAQQRLMLIEQLFPGTDAYHVPFAVRLRGPLDVPALRAAIDGVTARHESLRTTFDLVDGVAVQSVSDVGTVALEEIDLRGEPAAADDSALSELLATMATGRFDLGGQLWRIALLRCDTDVHVLAITMHHLVSDMWSCGLFVGETLEIYRASLDGRAADLPDLPAQYVDYAIWERDRLTDARLARLTDYWRDRLRDAPPLLALPTDRPRPATQSLRGTTEPVRLDPALSRSVETRARELGVTPFILLLSVFTVALGRWTGSTDVTVGTATANRTSDVEHLIGCFINVVPLRTSLAGGPTFTEVVRRVRDTVVGGFEHQDLPFDRIVEEVVTRRDLSYQPLTQVLFIVQNAPMPTPAGGPLRVETVPVRRGATQFDLDIQLWDNGTQFVGLIEHATDLFDRATIVRMWRQFETVLRAALADGDTPIAALDMTGGPAGLLPAPAATTVDPPVTEVFDAQVAATPEARAVVAGPRSLSYAQLDDAAERMAGTLHDRGAGPERPVALIMGRSVDTLVAMLAALKAGAPICAIDPATPDDRIRAVVADASPSVIVSDADLRVDLGVPVLTLAAAAEVAPTGAGPSGVPAADSLAYILHTSGSTGTPKGVGVTHRNLASLFAAHRASLFDPAVAAVGGRRMVAALTASLSFDTSWDAILWMFAGHELHIVDDEVRLDPAALVRYVRAHQVDFLDVTPTLCRQLVDAGLLDGDHRPAVLMLGGEPLDGVLWDRLAQATPRSFNYYGPTECTVDAVFAPIRPGRRPRLGRPLPNTGAYVLDPTGRPVPLGVPGELHLAGAGLARGYVGRPAETAARFVPDPFGPPGSRMYRTGDMVRQLPDEDLEFLGRTDGQVKVRGYRIELGDVEFAILGHPDVADAAAVVNTDAADARLVAYVVARPGATAPDSTAMRRHLESRLPGYMIPAHVLPLPALPITTTGKLDRIALAQLPVELPADVDSRAPAGAVEQVVADIWASVLQLDSVGADVDFFALGGHSLAAMRIIALVNEVFGLALTPRVAFDAPTVAQFARLVVETATAGGGDAVAIAEFALEIGDMTDDEVAAMLANPSA